MGPKNRFLRRRYYKSPRLIAAGTIALGLSARTFGATALAPYTVQPVVIIPSDRADNARGIAKQLAAMDARMAAISHWYSLALGLDMRLHVRPATAAYSVRPLSDFTNVGDITWFDRAKNVADNEYSVGSTSNPHIIVGAVWGGDAKALATDDLSTTGGGFAMVSTFASAGTLAHEIGHTFGLDHPAVNNPVTGKKDNDYTVMYEFTAWPNYPNNPADPSWNLRGMHAWDNNANGRYQDSFMLSNRSEWFRNIGARQMRFDPGGEGNISFGGSGSWQAPGIWSQQVSTTGPGPTTTELHVTWDNAGGPAGADAAVFAGGSASTINVTSASPVTVSSISFVSDNYVLSGAPITLTGEAYIAAPETSATIGNVLAGTNGLYKGQGTIILTGNCTYTGTTVIGAGVLTVGFGTTTGSLGLDPVVNHGELRFNRTDSVTVANDISGTGDVTKLGAGTLTLTGALSYEGITTVSTGTLELSSPLLTTSQVAISTGARLCVKPSAGVVAAESLSVSVTGALDLTSAKLIVTAGAVGAWNGSNYDGITGMIKSGRNNGAWNGSGLMTSMTAAASPGFLTSLAVATAADAGKSTFAGQSVSSTDVLVMYTYAGDANLDGKVNADDYFQIDSHYNNNTASSALSWINGDFNYDGKISGDDYFLIDNAYVGQGVPFAAASGADGPTAVPEPTIAGSLATVAMLSMRRQGRRRRKESKNIQALNQPPQFGACSLARCFGSRYVLPDADQPNRHGR